jgi:hypothetical protein
MSVIPVAWEASQPRVINERPYLKNKLRSKKGQRHGSSAEHLSSRRPKVQRKGKGGREEGRGEGEEKKKGKERETERDWVKDV